MPIHITLAALSFSTPDGHRLFSDLDLALPPVRTGLVGRNGVGKSTLLKLIAGELSPTSGSITIDGKVGILRQTLQPAPGETISDLFGVAAARDVLERAELGTATAQELADADWTLLARLEESLARLGLFLSPDTLLETLSGGQRTRAMLASLYFAAPDYILLDEPTNNLDRDGRTAVLDMLASWRGGAIVVSHDRELLEAMDAIVELSGLGAKSYGGNYGFYRAQKQIELASVEHQLSVAEGRVAQADRKAQQTLERQQKRDAGGRAKRAKRDMPKILLNARKNAAESTGGNNARVATRLRDAAQSDAQAARDQIEVLAKVTMDLPSTHLPPGKRVLALEDVAAGYEGETPIVKAFSLQVSGPERIAITGPNGSGKTTLLKTLSGQLAPVSGTADRFVPHAMLDQQVSLLEPTSSIRDNYLRLNPGSTENACRAALARFKFRADAALHRVGRLSGGETLRAGLACVLGSDTPPQLLILDEPTNHLDLDSIEAVEAGLRGYDGALIVVSHDRAFLNAIEITREISLA